MAYPSWTQWQGMLATCGRQVSKANTVQDTGGSYSESLVIGRSFTKCGSFSRSFNNIQKRVNVRSPPVGICHMCKAGQSEYPFEQIETRRPAWLATEFCSGPFFAALAVCYSPPAWTRKRGMPLELWLVPYDASVSFEVLLGFCSCLVVRTKKTLVRLMVGFQRSLQSTGCGATKILKGLMWQRFQKNPSVGIPPHLSLLVHGTKDPSVQFSWILLKQSFPVRRFRTNLCLAWQLMLARLFSSAAGSFTGQVCGWNLLSAKLVAECGFQFLRRYAQSATLAKNNGRCFVYFSTKASLFTPFYGQSLGCASAQHKGVQSLGDVLPAIWRFYWPPIQIDEEGHCANARFTQGLWIRTCKARTISPLALDTWSVQGGGDKKTKDFIVP